VGKKTDPESGESEMKFLFFSLVGGEEDRPESGESEMKIFFFVGGEED